MKIRNNSSTLDFGRKENKVFFYFRCRKGGGQFFFITKIFYKALSDLNI